MARQLEHSISNLTQADYAQIMVVWEASVRATHHFLSEAWIEEHRHLILEQYLDMVSLHGIRDEEGKAIAFLGLAEGNIEMLFVHPDHFRKGIGHALIDYAVKEQSATKVDVNEQNPGACKFYEGMGFEVISRSELDGQGNPFPILHMELGVRWLVD